MERNRIMFQNVVNYCALIDSNYNEKKGLFNAYDVIDNNDSEDNKFVMIGPWSNDIILKTHLTNLKITVENIYQTCTKYAMLATQFYSEESIKSISEELSKLIDITYSQYTSILNCPICWPLYDYLTKTIRSFYQSLQELTNLSIDRSDSQTIRSATGIVWEKCEEIKKLPLANKAAYRRDIMEKISVIKDTIREFDEYIEEFNKINQTNIENHNEKENDSDNDDEDDDENEQYTNDDVIKVNKCLLLLRFVHESLLLDLSLTSFIGEYSTSSSLTPDTHILIAKLLAKVTKQSNNLIDISIDLGSELYPPLVAEDISIHYHKLRDNLKIFYSLFNVNEIIDIISHDIILLEKFNSLNNSNLLIDEIIF